MKKLVFLLVALCLTAALFSCTVTHETKQEEAKIQGVTETPTETATPNEIASPSENDTTTPETVTPTEPEVVEPETTEPESEEPEENVVILPEADENTKYITIEFPEDFPEEPYVELNLVSPEEFEWGEYVPFIRYDDVYYEGGISTYRTGQYAILSSDSPTIEQGTRLYQKLNEKYLVEYKGEKLTSWYGDDIDEIFSDYLYKSRVVYISPDTDLIGRFSLTPKENMKWDGRYDIIIDGKIENTLAQEDLEPGRLTIGRFYNYIHPIQSYFFNNGTHITVDIHSNSYGLLSHHAFTRRTEGIVFSTNTEHNGDDRITNLLFYTKDKNKLTHIVKTVDSGISNSIFYAQDGNIQLIEFYEVKDGNYFQCVYALDINTGKLTYLESNAYEPNISPDGKYLIYRSPKSGDIPDGDFDTDSVPKREGLYVKNLKDGTTVCYKNLASWHNSEGLISWINEEKLMKLIEE